MIRAFITFALIGILIAACGGTVDIPDNSDAGTNFCSCSHDGDKCGTDSCGNAEFPKGTCKNGVCIYEYPTHPITALQNGECTAAPDIYPCGQ